MRKWLISIVVLILLIVGVGPYITGIMAERKMDQMIAMVPANSGISIKKEYYLRGWLKSEASYLITLDPRVAASGHNQPKVGAISIRSKQMIYHGPFIIGHSTPDHGNFLVGQALITEQVEIPDEKDAMLSQYVQQSELGKGDALIYLTGAIQADYRIPKVTIHSSVPGNHFELAGTTFNMHASSGLDAVKSETHIKSITMMSGPNNKVQLNDLAMQTDVSKGKYDLWYGTMQFSLASINASAPDQAPFTLQQLVVESNNTATGDVANMQVAVKFNKLVAQNEQYGPGDFNVELNNIGAKALAELDALAQQMQNAQHNPQLRSPQQLSQMMEVFTRLLSHGFQLIINPFQMTTPHGDVKVQAEMTLPNVSDRKALVPLPELLRSGNATLQISVPESLVREIMVARTKQSHQARQQTSQTAILMSMSGQNSDQVIQSQVNQQLSQLQRQGVLTEDNGNYIFSSEYKNGQLYINGKAMDLPGLTP